MNKYRHLHSINKVAIETDVIRVSDALLKFGAEIVETKLQRSHLHMPSFNRNTSKIVSYSPRSVAAVVQVIWIGQDQLDAVKAILSDLGVQLELARD